MKAHLSGRVLVILKEFLAELLGTCVLLMFGCGCVAQSVLSGKEDGGMLSINIGWGLGVLIGVMIAGPVSGKPTCTHKLIKTVTMLYRSPPKPCSEPLSCLCEEVPPELPCSLHGRAVPGCFPWLCPGASHL